MIKRRESIQVHAGSLAIGGGAPVSVQSMLNVPTTDKDAVIKQLSELEAAGCQLARLAVYSDECMATIREAKRYTQLPLVADIHFDHRLALGALEAGIDKLRINPGNIGERKNTERVASAAKAAGVPIRVGINLGSLEKGLLERYGRTPQAMAESALSHVAILEELGFRDVVISAKASDVPRTVEVYRLLAERCPYALHLGVTEAGAGESAIMKSAAGIGALLAEGIGDTIRVSLTEDPVREVEAGRQILKLMGMLHEGVDIISCPTCGRTRVNVAAIAAGAAERLKDIRMPLKVAVMGCIVNGPGEASEADVGIAGGNGRFAVFREGKVTGSCDEAVALDVLEREVRSLVAARGEN